MENYARTCEKEGGSNKIVRSDFVSIVSNDKRKTNKFVHYESINYLLVNISLTFDLSYERDK